MKFGFVGPSHGDLGRLRALCERCLFEWQVDRVFYLGSDDALDRAMHGWAERLGAPRDDAAFLDEAAALAPEGPPEVLDALLERDARRRRLADIAAVSTRHIEMIDDRVVVMTGDLTAPDDDDLANATVVVQGRSARPELRVVGVKCLLMPGDASRVGHAGLVERTATAIRAALYNVEGALTRETLVPLRRGSRMEVRS